MKFITTIFFISLSASAAEVCTYKGKPTWEGKTGIVKCTNFRGIPVREFQVKAGKPDGLEKKFLENQLIGIAWYEAPAIVPSMEIGFDDYGNVALITCGKKAYTDDDAKYCGFKGPYEHSFKNFKGELSKKARYINGEIVDFTTFFASGKIKEQMKLRDNTKKTTVYHEDGTISAEAIEINKTPVWEKEYYTENRLKSESVFQAEGEDMYLVRKKYHKNGVLEEEGKLHAATNWSKEYVVGELKRYHKNGQLSSRETYDKKGDLEGASTFFDDDGKAVLKRQFSQNKLMKEEKL